MEFAVCLPLPWIRDPGLRKAYSSTLGCLIGFYTYGATFFLYIAYVMLGWLLMKLLPRNAAAVLIPTISLALLLLRGIYQWFEGTNTDLNVKTTMMIAYIKLHYVSQNYKDAPLLTQKTHSLTARECNYASALTEAIPLRDWVDYFFFCGSIGFGMPLEYKDFSDFINLRGHYGRMPLGS